MQPGRIPARLCRAHTGLARFPPICTAAAGFTASPTIAFRSDLWSALEYARPANSIRTQRFRNGRPTRTSKKFLTGGKLVRYGAKVSSVRRLVCHAEKLSRRRPDHRRFRQLPRFAAPQRDSHSHQKRNTRRRNNFRSAQSRRYFTSKTLSAFPKKVEDSYIKKELWAVRNFHQSFQHGLLPGLFQTGLQFITGGRGLIDPMRSHEGYQAYKKLSTGQIASSDKSSSASRALQRRWQTHLRPPHGRLSLRHAPRRRSALPPASCDDLNVCATKCVVEYGNPCQYFCPAAVYEMAKDRSRQSQTKNQRRQLRALQNLRHRRPLPDHRLGRPRRRRRPKLRRHVVTSSPSQKQKRRRKNSAAFLIVNFRLDAKLSSATNRTR